MQVLQSFRLVALLLVTALTGCATLPPAPAAVDGGHCFATGPSYRPTRTCTTTAVPSAELEREAKRFGAWPDGATVYVVRRNWGDLAHRVPLAIDNRDRVDTIPHSFVRLRLPPGSHRLSIRWNDQVESLQFEARRGEVRFVEIASSLWSRGATYRWSIDDPEGAKRRASDSRLIADLAVE